MARNRLRRLRRLVIGTAVRERRFAPAPPARRPAPAFARRLKPGAVVVAVCLAGAAVCAGFVLTSAVGALAALPTTSQTAPLTADAKAQVEDLTAKAEAIQTDIDQLDGELEGYAETFNMLQLQLTDINTRMLDLRRQLSNAQKEHDYRVQKFQSRIVALYKSGGDQGLLSVLFEAHGLTDFFNRMRLMANLADSDQHLAAALSESAKKLDSLLEQIDDSKSQELALREQSDAQKDQIQAKLAARQLTLDGIDSNISTILAEQAARQQADTGPIPKTGNPVIDQLIETALYYQGIPYVWAGDRPATGFDCSGFVAYVFRQHGISLPHYSGYQAQMGYEIMPENIQAGDVLAFGWPVHHVGIYLGNGMFIHAPRTGDVVRIAPLSSRHDLAYIRRFNIQFRTGAPALW
jgi:peptidoglycan DL-endopeptidase CwlO